MAYEIVEQMNGIVPDAIVCCVGGGGLIGGMFEGIPPQYIPNL
jgi:threonine dehydratase